MGGVDRGGRRRDFSLSDMAAISGSWDSYIFTSLANFRTPEEQPNQREHAQWSVQMRESSSRGLGITHVFSCWAFTIHAVRLAGAHLLLLYSEHFYGIHSSCRHGRYRDRLRYRRGCCHGYHSLALGKQLPVNSCHVERSQCASLATTA